MEIFVKPFEELDINELYEILRLRVDVFVVEQNCPYPEIDGRDLDAIHIYLEDTGEILAYARLYEEDGQVHLGRVIAKTRRKGYGSLILKEAIEAAKNFYQAKQIHIEAQTYAKNLYKKVGFVEDSELFLLDGIEHIKMLLDLNSHKDNKLADNIFPDSQGPSKNELKKLVDKALANEEEAEPVDIAFAELWDKINNKH